MSENMISKIKIGNIEYELGTTIDNIDGLQNVLDSKATEDYVLNQIAEAKLDGSDIDLSGYATKDEIPTKTSQLTNDSGYLTEHQSLEGLATESYVNTQIVAILPEISGQIDTHNTAVDSHNDIRSLIDELQIEIDNKADVCFVAQSEEPSDTSVIWIDTDDNRSGYGSALPSVTTDHNGAFLRVVNGTWAVNFIPNAEEGMF